MELLKEINANEFCTKSADIWLNKWFLLTAGNMQSHNTMTVAWGSFGGMWARPFAQIVVRPGRYTFEFLEKHVFFTLCAFPEEHKNDVLLMGSKSGRDGDKLSETNLHIRKSVEVEAPSFEEAELIIECRKIYWQDMDPNNFLDKKINRQYPKKDYHRIYFGEILHIQGADEYCCK